MLARDHVLSVEHGQQKNTSYSTKCNNTCCDNRVLSVEKSRLSLSKEHV